MSVCKPETASSASKAAVSAPAPIAHHVRRGQRKNGDAVIMATPAASTMSSGIKIRSVCWTDSYAI